MDSSWFRASLIASAVAALALTPGCSCNGDDTDDDTDPTPAAVCGNGAVEAGEMCDDGNTTAGDGCSSSCQNEMVMMGVCGDGTTDAGEECDDGNTTAGDGCSPTCEDELPPECGNGVLEAGEACDDGNDIAYDGCEEDCTVSPEEVLCEMLAPLPSGTCEVTAGAGPEVRIKGDVLGPYTIFRGGQVVIDTAGMITCAGCDCDAMAPDASVVTCPTGIVSPGLINAHEHITFIQNDPYTDTGERYEHRHDWRTGANGHTEISGYQGSASNNAKLWGELRYVMSGATSIIGSGDVDGLLRNLDRDAQEGLNQPEVLYDTFPLGDSSGAQLDESCSYPSYTTAQEIATVEAYFPHVAEGISRVARNEFICTEGSAPGGEDLLEPQSAYIHAVGLNPVDYLRMADQGTSLIWSPRSNVTLYGDTAVVSTAARLGVNIALGTDWIPTGSMNMQRELQCADGWNKDYLDGFFSDRDLWRMATLNAAAAAAVDDAIGVLAPGRVADIAIFDGAQHLDYRAVIDAEPSDVVLTMRGGEVLYGDDAVVQALGAGPCDTFDVCGSDKAVCATSDFGMTYAALAAATTTLYPLFFCGAVQNEPSCTPTRPLSVSGSTVYDGVATAGDPDGDGIDDAADNCPTVFNPVRPMDGGEQADFDRDGEGDPCDPCPLDPGSAGPCSAFDADDIDNDGVANAADNCVDAFNDTQTDGDGDDKGDVCDRCPMTANPGTDACPVSIYDIKLGLATGVVGLVNKLVTGCSNGNGFFLQASSADADYNGPDYSGIYVYHPSVVCGTTLSVGDRVTLNPATVSVYNGQTQLGFATVTVDSSLGEAPPAAELVTPAAVGGNMPTPLEGVIVSVENVLTTGQNVMFHEFEVAGELIVNDLLYAVMPLPAVNTPFTSISGILNFRNGRQKLEPRSAADVTLGPPVLVGFAPALSYIRVGDVGAPTIPTPLTVTLSGPVSVDTDVTVVSTEPSSLTVVGDVATVLAGNSSATVLVNGLAQDTSVQLTATLAAASFPATVRVVGPAEQPQLVDLSPTMLTVSPMGTGALTVTLDIPAGAGGHAVNLSLDTTTYGTVPASVVVAQDALTASFDFTATAVEGSAILTADDGVAAPLNATIEVAQGSGLVINELDYDQPGTDMDEFVELFNNTGSAIDLTNVIVVFVNGAGGMLEYRRVDLTPVGTLGPGRYLVIGPASVTALVPMTEEVIVLPGSDLIQNGAPDAVGIYDLDAGVLMDALSYEGSVGAGVITGVGAEDFVEMTPPAASDNNASDGSLVRIPNGADSDDASADWVFTTTMTPGTPNVP
jgi:cysteine-rich repeat protein